MALSKPIRVAILGAGPAGLAAAWGLTAPEQNGRYEVTLYQSGWQAGGLCSTGRVAPEMWVNQNGTHYLFGAYGNTFRLCQQAYAELHAAGHHALGTFEEQFVARDRLVLKQFFKGQWTDWVIQFPTNTRVPGSVNATPDQADVAAMVVQWLLELLTGAEGLDWLQKAGVFSRAITSRTATQLLRAALVPLRQAATGRVDAALLAATASSLRGLRRWLWWVLEERITEQVEALRLWILMDLGIAVALALLEDEELRARGFAGIDGLDLREWLTRWGASEESVWSPAVTAWYNAIAGYEGGDLRRPNVSAGVSLASLFHLLGAYSGSFAYQITWSIGDSLIGPLYQALVNRGVSFAFFHRVWKLTPDAAGERIETVELERQVELASGDPLSYRPFVTIRGRPVWPDQPDWEQIVGGDPGGPRLNSFYAERRGKTLELRAGRDFDVLISAMGSAVYRYYAPELVRQSPRWKAIVEQLRTVETQSLRLWFHDDLPGLGWLHGAPIVSGFAQPFATWEDPTPLLASELWNPPARTLAHLFGPLPHPQVYPAPEAGPDYERRQQERAELDARAWLDHSFGHLWPGAVDKLRPPSVDWTKLVHHQIRANPGPVEAYTMITAGSLAARPRVDESGYTNLLLAGDWTRNGFEVGSVEGAVLSGLQASRALSGLPARITGTPTERG